MQPKNSPWVVWLIAVALLFPLFIQLSGGIYNASEAVTDSGGVLGQLPLPLSIAACLFGLFVFVRNYRQALPAMLFIGSFFGLMLVSLLLAGEDQPIQQRKVLIGLQFLLPTMGLVLGQLIRDNNNIIPRAFMWVLLLVAPLQILASWLQKTLTLTHNLYFFSIYQHFQFVPVIFVLAFCMVTVYLWSERRGAVRFLTAIMGMYALASASFLAIGLYVAFVVIFFVLKIRHLKTGRLVAVTVFSGGVLAAVLLAGLYYWIAQNNTNVIGDAGQYFGKFQRIINGQTPLNVEHRLGDWKLYGNWIRESDLTLLLGHAEPPPREVKTSAHNWYLDFVYNFGLIPLLPLLVMIAVTAWLALRHRRTLPGQTLWLAALVVFIVLVDSNFKVTLRQPYPGIFSFFLWGLLLTRLRDHASASMPGKAGPVP